MDSKQGFLPALALGVGLGLGVATVCTQTINRWADSPLSPCVLESELLAQVVDGGDSKVTFDKFPYYLSEETKALLTNAAFMHLKHSQMVNFTRNLSPASRSVLLLGPTGTERYHEMLASALAHSFQAKLLILDISEFSFKMQIKYSSSKHVDESMSATKDSVYGLVQCISGLFGSDSTTFTNRPRIVQSFLEEGGSASFMRSSEVKGSLKRTKSMAFEDKALVVALYRVLLKLSDVGPVILYLRDLEKIVLRGSKTVSLFQKMFNKLSGPVFVLSSRILEESPNEQVAAYINQKAAALFAYKVSIKPPVDNVKLVSWKSQLEEDMKAIQAQDNRKCLTEVLDLNDVICEDLDSVYFTDVLFGKLIEEIVVSAISHHLMHTDEPHYCNGRLVISSTSIAYGLSLFQAGSLQSKDVKLQTESNPKPSKDLSESSRKEAKCEGLSEVVGESESRPKNGASKKSDTDGPKKSDTAGPKNDANTKGVTDVSKKEDGANISAASSTTEEVVADNEFEKRIRPEIIPAGEIGVSFQDIGALDNVKEAMQELVMLPLQRPDLFRRGGLIKPCKGILLFGPPGTGKTMLAKAVATEAGASFINVSMSTITSKWFGEDEKNVRALFTLASKVAPTIIFIDEVDSMLGQRSRAGEHEAMRKIKNEFMAHWDGLLSKSGQRVLVLAATNRPFDLDDAIIRRFERRIMVDLPDKENRERILKAILAKETVSNDLDFVELANMTEGYSGSDLRNLCTVAAYRPIRELLKTEQMKNGKDLKKASDSHTCKDGSWSEPVKTDMPEPSLRPLNMEDMRQAKSQVSSSFAAEGAGMAELKEWNQLFGEGGSRKKQQLSYFL